MFTGIIEAVGDISQIQQHGTDLSITVTSQELDFSDVKLGDSIATNGVCLTVTSRQNQSFTADVSAETIAYSQFGQYQVGQRVNLEKAMLASSRFGGHIVSGHVDAVTQVTKIVPEGRALQVWLAMPSELARYIAHKGSVTVDGISLTVNSVQNDSFRLTIVPHTAAQTTVSQLKVGTKVHIEVDVIARYLERLTQASHSEPAQGVTKSLLSQRGFI
ncbi:riboflavin synthase [Rheinheimera sp. WS51]|uniref:riboflavin synthase n=1 Tax=Rheinheimera sp. WS51 TaxID=3425886 RepID=UPI003D9471AB